MNTLNGALERHVNRFDGDAGKPTNNDPRTTAREALTRQVGAGPPLVVRTATVADLPDAPTLSAYGALGAALGRR